MDGTPTPKPQWVEAFMIFLLAKAGGSATLSLDRLNIFSTIKGETAPKLSYNEDEKTVTLSLPEIEISSIIVPEKRIIAGLN